MKYQIDQFKVSPKEQNQLSKLLQNKYKLKRFTYKILQKSIDARNKENVVVIYKIMIETEEPLRGKNVRFYRDLYTEPIYTKWSGPSPVIVGFGPAGMFAGLYLARCGARPIIIERGSKIEERKKEVQRFLKEKALCHNSNVQFGEGGAGAFSDGKLVSNVKDPLITFILKEFYLHGAKEDILYESKPHIGTDCLEMVVRNIRLEIEALGGIFYFNHTFTGAHRFGDTLVVETDMLPPIETKHLLLGLGHSARDTIRFLYHDMHLQMEQKSFSMGVRIEHPAKWINESQYGAFARYLPPAYYKLAAHQNERGVYTFCMCPGGYVLASASEDRTIVTNGMSNQKRDGLNSNSAILVEVKPEDYDRGTVLDGMEYQERYERLAFELSGDYRAPANLVKEFMEDTVAIGLRSVSTTYPHGLYFTDFRKCLPGFVVDGIKYGIGEFDKKLKGFRHGDAVLIGVETRSSSPVRILRDENRQASMRGIYPIGEGAGYAGGITSAALDGLKTAISICEKEKR